MTIFVLMGIGLLQNGEIMQTRSPWQHPEQLALGRYEIMGQAVLACRSGESSFQCGTNLLVVCGLIFHRALDHSFMAEPGVFPQYCDVVEDCQAHDAGREMRSNAEAKIDMRRPLLIRFDVNENVLIGHARSL